MWQATNIAHVLNRIAYGPRRRDWQQVEALGVEGYVRRQLEPGALADEAVDAKLRALTTLEQDVAELYRDYPPPQLARRMMRQDEEPDEAELRRLRAQSRIPLQESATARLVRAVESERQLQEVLVDFWFNHFNVFANTGQMQYLVPSFERDSIRPYVLGSFRGLLGAVARSPAMLVYLDNWRSAAEDGREVAGPPPRARNDAVEDAIRRMRAAGRPRAAQRMQQMQQRRQAADRPPGLNENYARELMELHTLGVEGGYTQHDVREVARALTGWTLTLGGRPAGGDAGFVFRPDWHDAEPKQILGNALAGGRGIEDGEDVLDLLAAHPSTAVFVATKLCRKFVADDPPDSLVRETAGVFARTAGDLRATTAAVLLSDAFLGSGFHSAKVKSPLEFLASAARALELPVAVDGRMVRALGLLGAPLYGASAPTGYPDTAADWTSANAILARMDAGSLLAEAVFGRRRGPRGSSRQRIDALLRQLLPGGVGDETRRRIDDWAATQPEEPGNGQIATLILGSPEFQRR